MIKAIIFDLDNTLIDFLKMKHMSIAAAASAMIDAGLTHSKSRIVKRLFKLYDIHGYEDKTIFQRYLTEELGKVDYRILASGINAYRRVRSGFLESYPHVMETLIKLKEKGIKLAIVSDAPKLKVWIRLTAMKLEQFFDVVVGFEDSKKLKPSRKPFMIALKQIKMKPENCMMVGDVSDRDIKGGKKLGMKTVFAKYGNPKIHKTKADFEITDISQLVKLV